MKKSNSTKRVILAIDVKAEDSKLIERIPITNAFARPCPKPCHYGFFGERLPETVFFSPGKITVTFPLIL